MSEKILPGDILLHMGKSEISKVIAWVGNSRHSHVAIVLEPGVLIETTPSKGVGKSSLHNRLLQKDVYHWIDVYRFQPDLKDWLESLTTEANYHIGKSYAVNEVVWLGLLCAFRNKVPQGELARQLVRLALDQALKSDTQGLTCSEFVYRCFADAKTKPPHELRPKIKPANPTNPPFPEVDWWKLWQEYKQAIKPSTFGLDAYDGTPPAEAEQPVTDKALNDSAAAVRERLGMRADLPAAPAADATKDLLPNPKTVEPGDLANSPNFLFQKQVLP